MIIKELIEYPEFKEWKEIEISPKEFYKILSHPIGYRYYKI